ncbi:MAG TPA: hypothetical protein VFQ35_06780 [Polyangiaceae bacterium]|nr:hypothetical protein [Polyangiaceae bacterium]
MLGAIACGAKQETRDSGLGLGGSPPASGGSNSLGGVTAEGGSTGGSNPITLAGGPTCVSKTCKELGYACGSFQNDCGGITNCADEGLKCNSLEACLGGVDGPTTCTSTIGPCDVCDTVPDCSKASQPTRLSGRVITAGRKDTETANQVGVPNAVVYVSRSLDVGELPAIPSGIPADGMSCDRCEDQKLGPVLVGTTTDSTGRFTLEGTIPVGGEFMLVVKVGRFRRAVKMTLPGSAACQTTMLPTTLPDNPTRLPRTMTDGLAVNIPRVAVSTGEVDAMECVLEKMGIADSEFGNPGTQKRVHLYRGGRTAPGTGASIDSSTPLDSALYGDLSRLLNYDILIADCEGSNWDQTFTQRDASGANVREYVNRGGRMFASHLSFSWLIGNGTGAYDAQNPIATGLGTAADWDPMIDSTSATGNCVIASGRPQASPRIQNFSDWAAAEGVITPPATSFTIKQPRSSATRLGPSTEEFVYRTDGTARTQQFSFNTPYAAPSAAVCGRVAYSGFHVAASDDLSGMQFADAVFPAHCAGTLTPQEKVLLYMLFDLGACVGTPPPPPMCTPTTCKDANAKCGYIADGCGSVVDCGVCPPPR